MSSTVKLLLGVVVSVAAVGIGIGCAQRLDQTDLPTAGKGSPGLHERVPPPDATAEDASAAAEAPGQGAAAADLALLRRELEQLKEQIAVLGAAGVARPAEDSTKELTDLKQQLAVVQREWNAEEAPPDPATEADLERDRQVEMAKLEQSLAQEPVDRAWADKTSATVLEVLGSPEADRLEALSLECRSRTCRLELANDDAAATAKMLPLLLHRLGQTLPSSVANQVDHPDGRRSTILYMSRGGSEDSRPKS